MPVVVIVKFVDVQCLFRFYSYFMYQKFTYSCPKMNFTEERSVEWKPSANICRCCLAEGCYKDISSVYYFSGDKEVYEEMLKETLDIQIPCIDGASRFICELCISHLRGAFSFKKSVLHSVTTLNKYYEQLHYKDENKTDGVMKEEVKAEPLPVDGGNDTILTDAPDDACTDDGSMEDDEILANIKLEISTMADDKVANRNRKKKSKIKSAKSKIKMEDAADLKREEDWVKIAERRGNGPILRENSLKLLANSTMCVFQWNKSRYRCFCCKEPFSDMDLLKQHTNNAHTLENIKKKIILQQNRLVKVEVSKLLCKICQTPVENFSNLREHLSTHNIKFELNEDLLVPFKIETNLRCQICSEDFTVFRLLNMHMNKHYQKQVCHICGAAFSNLVFLNLHKTRTHRPFRCKLCGELFTSKTDKKHHEISVHNMKYERKLRFPCPYCSDRFFQENFRVLHLVEKHGLPRPDHKCLVCEKSFVTRSLCNNHMKNVHMKEKNHECDVCHNLFYTKSDVARHRVTHTGEKRFSCSLCSSPFATKDSLRRHMKRTHGGVN